MIGKYKTEVNVAVAAVVNRIEAKFKLNFRPFQRIVYIKVLNEENVFVCHSGKTHFYAFCHMDLT